MRSSGDFDPDGAEAVAAQVASVMEGWGLRGGAARLWVRAAAGHVRSGPAEWVLEHDPQLALVSFEVWSGSRRLFGIDDWLG